MGFLGLLIIGAAVGYLATRMMGMDLPVPQTVALGVLGAILGGWIVRLAFGLFGGILGAFVGVVLLIWAYNTFVLRK